MGMMMVTQGGIGLPPAPLRCLIDQRCWCFDCQAKDHRLRVKMPTVYRRGIDEPLCEGMEDCCSLCLNKTQPTHRQSSQCLALKTVPPLPVKVTRLDLQSLSRPQEEINNHTVSPAVRKDCLFPRKHGDTFRVVGRGRERSRRDLRD